MRLRGHVQAGALVAVLLAAMGPARTAVHAQASGPFGLAMGLSKDAVEKLVGGPLKATSGQNHEYLAPRVPRLMDGYAEYRLRILPKAGLCAIVAVGTEIPTSSQGAQLKAAFEQMAKLVEASYGKYGKADFLRTSSLWTERDDWMMGVMKRERVLQAAWDADEGLTMRNQVKQVLLSVNAQKADAGFLTLQYKFDNDAACEEERKRLTAGVL